MEYVAFAFGIFGLCAFLELSSLKGRISKLEEQLTKTEGTSYHLNRQELLRAARSYVGKSVVLELKEDHEDIDVMHYGNTKHGTNTIVDVDDEWMLVRIETPKTSKDKLIRLESIERISVIQE